MRANKLNALIAKLIESGLVVTSRPIDERKTGRGRWNIEVGDTSATRKFVASYENSLRHYVDMFDEGRYSLMMCDGGLVSIKYAIDGDEMVWHRFAYVPPIVALEVAGGEGVSELPPADGYLEVPRKAMLRFEYDPDAFAVRHPYSRLHLNSPECRIPVSGWLGVKDFLYFLVDAFYPAYLESLEDLRPAQNASAHISADDKRRPYLKLPL